MKPRIVEIEPLALVGISRKMTFSDYRISELWLEFQQRKKAITRFVSKDLYSVVKYAEDHFEQFDPGKEFTRWAAILTDDLVPEGFESLVIEGGLYAVFDYKGSDPSIFTYIYQTWLPQSGFVLDNRHHFEVLGERYKNGSPDSEEEIWVPVRRKGDRE
ncbi:GyrI-like domain-containing protein [Leadbetterella byssophila]|uniref:GyrI-like domain-containing protein n=1 Tax=Leadbetterella byssophila TaxID=316068 RepID=UPI0039A39D3B